ncbi:MAG: phage portal protein [Gemmataceae bacterium]
MPRPPFWAILKSVWPRRSAPALVQQRPRLTPTHLPQLTAGWWRDDPAEQLRQYQSWVYAAVNAIAQEVARQRPFLGTITGPAEHERTPLPRRHPLVRLLEAPNPWLTPWELWYLTLVYLELTGNCFWTIARRADGTPAELWVVPTPWVRIQPDPQHFLAGYTVQAPGGPAEVFAPGDVVHLKYPNPLDPHYGLSPLQANALTIDANQELLKSRFHAFQQGPRPGMVLQTDQTLTDTTITRMEEKILGKFAGRANWQRPLVLEQGLKASPWTLAPAEMDFLNSSRMSREEIFALYRVPPPVAGLIENTGLGGEIWYGARALFCESTIQPKLELLAQSLTRSLGAQFGPDVQIHFPECSPRNREQLRQDEELDARLGLRTVNEIRRARGLRPYADPQFDQPRGSAIPTFTSTSTLGGSAS